jgi:hypothetical protein
VRFTKCAFPSMHGEVRQYYIVGSPPSRYRDYTSPYDMSAYISRDETCGDAKTPDITYGDLSYGDETYGYVTYRDVSSLYPPCQGVGQKRNKYRTKNIGPNNWTARDHVHARCPCQCRCSCQFMCPCL